MRFAQLETREGMVEFSYPVVYAVDMGIQTGTLIFDSPQAVQKRFVESSAAQVAARVIFQGVPFYALSTDRHKNAVPTIAEYLAIAPLLSELITMYGQQCCAQCLAVQEHLHAETILEALGSALTGALVVSRPIDRESLPVSCTLADCFAFFDVHGIISDGYLIRQTTTSVPETQVVGADLSLVLESYSLPLRAEAEIAIETLLEEASGMHMLWQFSSSAKRGVCIARIGRSETCSNCNANATFIQPFIKLQETYYSQKDILQFSAFELRQIFTTTAETPLERALLECLSLLESYCLGGISLATPCNELSTGQTAFLQLLLLQSFALPNAIVFLPEVLSRFDIHSKEVFLRGITDYAKNNGSEVIIADGKFSKKESRLAPSHILAALANGTAADTTAKKASKVPQQRVAVHSIGSFEYTVDAQLCGVTGAVASGKTVFLNQLATLPWKRTEFFQPALIRKSQTLIEMTNILPLIASLYAALPSAQSTGRGASAVTDAILAGSVSHRIAFGEDTVAFANIPIHALLSLTVADALAVFWQYRGIGEPLLLLHSLGYAELCLGADMQHELPSLSGFALLLARLNQLLWSAKRPRRLTGHLFAIDDLLYSLPAQSVVLLLAYFKQLVQMGASVYLVSGEDAILEQCDTVFAIEAI